MSADALRVPRCPVCGAYDGFHFRDVHDLVVVPAHLVVRRYP